jgi:predicted dehydrogenase
VRRHIHPAPAGIQGGRLRRAVLCNRHPEKAEAHRKSFYPDASVTADYRGVLARDDIEVVDITTHPAERAMMIREAIDAGKHILSQKPFVEDLDLGLRLVERADRKGVRLAVNQNGRWAPHWSWIRAAVSAGLLGRVTSTRLAVNWDHNSQALIEYEDGQATLFFDANSLQGAEDCTHVTGTLGSAWSSGLDLNAQEVAFATAEGVARPRLSGAWFPDGFHGAMGELLTAIEQKREPSNGGRENLASLALCFAAVESARRGAPVAPGTVRRLPR